MKLQEANLGFITPKISVYSTIKAYLSSDSNNSLFPKVQYIINWSAAHSQNDNVHYLMLFIKIGMIFREL